MVIVLFLLVLGSIKTVRLTLEEFKYNTIGEWMLVYGGKMVSKVSLASYGMEMFPPLYFEFETSSRSYIQIETL